MAGIEDIVEDHHDYVMNGSDSEADEDGDRVFEGKNCENGFISDPVVVETKSVVDSTSDTDFGLVDMEKGQNGLLSSLLDKNGDVSGDGENLKRVIEVPGTDNGKNGKEQGKNNMGDLMEDLNSVFRVGDFVWGKIKSHPWWPGQIYDPKDASDFAAKYRQEGRLLVAFFGDGSCSWCLPSQLVPFVQNFKLKSTDSSSKSFMNAILNAVNDIGRIVEYNMTCKCILPLDKRDGITRPLVSNAGIKKGVLVPDVDIRRLCVPEYDPSEILEKLLDYAKDDVNVECLLELTVLRSWLSVFYRAKGGGYRLPLYCEPVCIEGLEDKSKNVNVSADDELSAPIEVPILGPWEDVYLSSHAAKSEESSDVKIYHRRKHKSVAELMGEKNDDIFEPESRKRAKVKGGGESGKSTSGRKRRKNEDEVKKGFFSVKPMEIEVEAAEKSTTSVEPKEESEVINTPRERKKSKYLSPPYTDSIRITGNSGLKMKSISDKLESDEESDEELPIVQLKLSFSLSDVNIQVSELLSEIQLAAVDHLYLSKKGSLNMIWAFVSAFRSSTYLEGSGYKIFKKCRTGSKKRKSLKNEENDVAQKKTKSADDPKASKPDTKSNSNKSSEFSHAKNSNTEKLEVSVSTRLIVTFTPDFALPSKEEIVSLFSKFGSLNEKETYALTESHSFRIVYTKGSDAEAAFKSCVRESPFGAENVVNYTLQHSSSGAKSRPEISSRAFEKPDFSQPADDFMSDVGVIWQKLEIMTAILENYHFKFSAEEKTSLKDDMKRLMENVEKVSEKVRIMAEKISS